MMHEIWPKALYMASHAPSDLKHLFAAAFFFQQGYGYTSYRLADLVMEALAAEKREGEQPDKTRIEQ